MRLLIFQRSRYQSPTDGAAEEGHPFVLWDVEASADLVRWEEGNDFGRGDVELDEFVEGARPLFRREEGQGRQGIQAALVIILPT
jgi:hypothetical protein